MKNKNTPWDIDVAHDELIVCPICGQNKLATVKHTSPFYTYIHKCDCGYIILESEWELADI